VYQSLYDGPLLCGFNVAIKGLKFHWMHCRNAVPAAPIIEIQRSHTSNFIKTLRGSQLPDWGPKAGVQFPQLWFSTLTASHASKQSDQSKQHNTASHDCRKREFRSHELIKIKHSGIFSLLLVTNKHIWILDLLCKRRKILYYTMLSLYAAPDSQRKLLSPSCIAFYCIIRQMKL